MWCHAVQAAVSVCGVWDGCTAGRGEQGNPVLVSSTPRSRRACVPSWRSTLLRGFWDSGILEVKIRQSAVLGSAPAQQGEPDVNCGSEWCSMVTRSTQTCRVHHPLPWDWPQGVPLSPAGNTRYHAPSQSPVLSQLACCRRWDSDGLQHLHIFPGRKCQVLQGSISCQQRAGQEQGHAEEWVLISNEQRRGQEGESHVPLPRPSAYSLSWAPSLLLVIIILPTLGWGKGPIKHPCSSGGVWGRPQHGPGNELLQLMVPLCRGLQTCSQIGLHHLRATCCS